MSYPLNSLIDVIRSTHSDNVDGKYLRVGSTGSFQPPGTSDAIVATYPSATTEVYTYKTGGTSGTTTMVITVTYTDSTKAVLSTVVKT